MKKGYNLAKIFQKKIQMYFLCKQRLTGGYHFSQFTVGAECAALNGIWTVNRVFMISGSTFLRQIKGKLLKSVIYMLGLFLLPYMQTVV